MQERLPLDAKVSAEKQFSERSFIMSRKLLIIGSILAAMFCVTFDSSTAEAGRWYGGWRGGYRGGNYGWRGGYRGGWRGNYYRAWRRPYYSGYYYPNYGGYYYY